MLRAFRVSENSGNTAFLCFSILVFCFLRSSRVIFISLFYSLCVRVFCWHVSVPQVCACCLWRPREVDLLGVELQMTVNHCSSIMVCCVETGTLYVDLAVL